MEPKGQHLWFYYSDSNNSDLSRRAWSRFQYYNMDAFSKQYLLQVWKRMSSYVPITLLTDCVCFTDIRQEECVEVGSSSPTHKDTGVQTGN